MGFLYLEQGIITKSTKKRLDELESTKENLETEIVKENISHPLLTKEFLYSWFDGFKNFDVNKLKNRKMLIDTFVNSVVLYDDRIDFYFNFKDNAKSLTLSELNTVSDLSSSSPPIEKPRFSPRFFLYISGNRNRIVHLLRTKRAKNLGLFFQP